MLRLVGKSYTHLVNRERKISDEVGEGSALSLLSGAVQQSNQGHCPRLNGGIVQAHAVAEDDVRGIADLV